MRTTIAIDDHLLDAARRAARRRGTTLGHVIEDALRRDLSETSAPPEGPPTPVFRGGTGPHPGVDLTSNRALSELLDEGRPLGKLR